MASGRQQGEQLQQGRPTGQPRRWLGNIEHARRRGEAPLHSQDQGYPPIRPFQQQPAVDESVLEPDDRQSLPLHHQGGLLLEAASPMDDERRRRGELARGGGDVERLPEGTGSSQSERDVVWLIAASGPAYRRAASMRVRGRSTSAGSAYTLGSTRTRWQPDTAGSMTW